MSGFYLMHRGWMDNPVFGGSRREPYCRRAAWIWLIEHALYEDTTMMVAGKLVELKRGQLSYSYRYLAAAWGWSVAKVFRYCSAVVSAKMITCSGDTGQAVITICNYDQYQVLISSGETDGGVTVKRRRNTTETNKNERELQEQQEEEIPTGILSENGSRRPADIAATMTLIWNEVCGFISRANKPNPSRTRRLVARWRADFGGRADDWAVFCRRVAAAPHLRGENDRGWHADLDWVLKPENLCRIAEGRYEPKGPANGELSHDRPTGPPPRPDELWPDLKEPLH